MILRDYWPEYTLRPVYNVYFYRRQDDPERVTALFIIEARGGVIKLIERWDGGSENTVHLEKTSNFYSTSVIGEIKHIDDGPKYSQREIIADDVQEWQQRLTRMANGAGYNLRVRLLILKAKSALRKVGV